VEEGDARFEFIDQLFADGVGIFGDDHNGDHFIDAFEDEVDHFVDEEKDSDGEHGFFEIEDEGGGADDEDIDCEQEGADGDVEVFIEPDGHHFGAVDGGSVADDEADAEAEEEAAIENDENLRGGDGGHGSEEVESEDDDDVAVGGADDELGAERFPAGEEQGDIEGDKIHPDRVTG